MKVYLKEEPVTIIILSRPEVRNTVDHETAKELAKAFFTLLKVAKRQRQRYFPEIMASSAPVQI